MEVKENVNYSWYGKEEEKKRKDRNTSQGLSFPIILNWTDLIREMGENRMGEFSPLLLTIQSEENKCDGNDSLLTQLITTPVSTLQTFFHPHSCLSLHIVSCGPCGVHRLSIINFA